MPLRNPSEFFDDKNKKSPLDITKEELINVAPKNLETISEAYDSFKTNLNQIQKLSNFTETVDSFKLGLEKVNSLTEVVEQIENEIQDLVKKEDLDDAVMSQLFFFEESLKKTQNKIKALNSNTLLSVKEEFNNLSNLVSNFISNEVPLYKKLVTESETRIDSRFLSYKDSIDLEVQNLNKKISKKLEDISKNINSINEESLSSVNEGISFVEDKINFIIEQELPKYKKIFAQTELKTEQRISESENRIQEYSKSLEKNYTSRINQIEENLNQFINSEIPKFKNTLVEFKLNTEDKIKVVSNDLDKNIKFISESFDCLKNSVEKNNINSNQTLEKNIIKIEQFINESKEEILSLSKTYDNFHKDFKSREIYESKKLEECSSEIEEITQKILNLENSVSNEFFAIKENIDLNDLHYQDAINFKISEFETSILEKVKDIEVNFYRNESHIKDIKESLQDTLSKIKLDEIEKSNEKITKKIEHLEHILESFNEKTFLKEDGSLLTGTTDTKSADPLTPLDKKFVTFEDLSAHYRQFINRVQIQLSSIGGGGAGFIKDLDDISFDQTTGDGKLLIYDQSNSRWVGIASTALSSGGDLNTTLGLGNTSSLGMTVGVITATGFVGDVTGNSTGLIGTPDIAIRNITGVAATFTGNVSIAGTLTYEDVTNVDSIGIITARSDVIVQQNLSVAGVATFNTTSGVGTVYVGLGSTALYVDGNARVTGILTVGRASVVIDGDNNTITAGDVLITGSSITIGDNVTINTGATGINSAPNVIYVAKDGDDAKNGTSIDNAKLTIAGAVSVAQTGTTIKVLSGTYNENNPIEVPAFVSIVGDNLKTVTVIPNNSTEDIFHVNKGTYLANMTFVGHTAPSAAVAFPPTIATNIGGGKWESPYVQNCTSNTTTGTGMRIDGDLAEGLKSMVVDSYTQYNQGGVGIAVTNNGYAQLVSVFTICCNEGITAYKGGQCSLTNSNTDFGTYGLVADGTSDLQFTGIVTTSTSVGTDTVAVAINTSVRPYEGQVLYFDTLYYTVESITVTNGGTGYTSTPSVTIGTPTGPNGSTATAFATLEGDRVSTITIISSGSQYASTPSVTISAPDSGITATATASIAPIYYTINSSTPVVSGITTVTLDENLNNTVGVGTTAYFYQVSRITASSHTFEYVGTGNDITTATPLRGGVPVQENEVVTRNGGRVDFTSTDQSGNFRIGDGIVINQNNGTISGRAFTRSLFNQMTPFILALS